MNDELNENEILLIDKLKEIGEDEDSIIGIAIIAIQEEMVDELLEFIENNKPKDFSDILAYIFPDAESLGIEDI